MDCTNCGLENPDDSAFCQMCGTDLGHSVTGPYLSRSGRAWWYPIGVWVIFSGFVVFVEWMGLGSIRWSLWPVGISGILLVGFTLLRHANERYSQRSSVR